MQWIRTGSMARMVAMVFLLWTGVDLFNPAVCAIDQRAQTESAKVAAVTDGAEPSTTIPHASTEDCFCCCQHVEATTAWVSNPQGVPAIAHRPVFIAPVRVVSTRLDHPPRFA